MVNIHVLILYTLLIICIPLPHQYLFVNRLYVSFKTHICGIGGQNFVKKRLKKTGKFETKYMYALSKC